jgi:RND superfamily putative drug exporter
MAGSERLAAVVIRWRWAILGGWLALAAAMVPLAGSIEDRLTVAARVPRSESAALDETLATRFDTPFARWLAVVMTGVPAPTTDSGRALLERATRLVAAQHGITRTFSYLGAPDTLFVGSHGRGQLFVAGLDSELGRPERILPSLREATAQLQHELRVTYPAATVRWTGEVALNADLRQASALAAQRAERRALPLTLVVLVIAFGALAAAVLPLAGAAVAVVVTLGMATVHRASERRLHARPRARHRLRAPGDGPVPRRPRDGLLGASRRDTLRGANCPDHHVVRRDGGHRL